MACTRGDRTRIGFLEYLDKRKATEVKHSHSTLASGVRVVNGRDRRGSRALSWRRSFASQPRTILLTYYAYNFALYIL